MYLCGRGRYELHPHFRLVLQKRKRPHALVDAKEVPLDKLEVGDIVQLGRATGDFYHSPVVVGFSRGKILVAAHSYDVYNKPLNSYNFAQARGIHILGVRK